MRKQLKPIAGALIAGLIGVAHATCWFETSYVCATPDTDAGLYCACGGCDTMHPTSNWYGWDLNEAEPPHSDLYQSYHLEYCHGTAVYFNYCTMSPQTTGPIYTGDAYNKVDYNNPCQ
jgi:hypothetical protein